MGEFIIKEAHPAYLHYMAKSVFGAYRGHLIELENRHLLDIVRRQTLELEEKRDKLRAYALADPMTGFYHEATFLEVLRKLFGQSRRSLRPLTVLHVGLDCLTQVEETFGEEFGDTVLRDVAAQIAGVFRESDSLARLPGGRYAVLLPDTPPENAACLVDRLRARLQEMSFFDGKANRRVTISAGVAAYPGPGIVTAEAMMEQAARFLVQAQAQGGNRVLVSPSEESEVRRLFATGPLARIGDEIARWTGDLRARQQEAARTLVARMRAAAHPWVHAARSTEIAVAIARAMDLPPDRVAQIETAALLHDLGMAAVPAEVLDRRGPLSAAERKVVERHPEWSLQIARALPFLQEELVLIRHHHERMDGEGYPYRLAGTAIPLGSRILACADAFVAMTEARPYRATRKPKGAVKEIADLAGTWFDPEVVAALRAAAR
jgi:diguanylate cyclase (GGDEF)-like protein